MVCKECGGFATTAEYCHACLSETKICRRCGNQKSIFDFEKNQRSIAGKISRRGECKDCRKRKTPINQKAKRQYEQANPKPPIGAMFRCPICDVSFTRQFVNDVVLDHDHDTGEMRGYICRMCNSGIGMMEDSPTILARAIAWLQGKLISFF